MTALAAAPGSPDARPAPTLYVVVAIQTLVDASDPADLAAFEQTEADLQGKNDVLPSECLEP